jgi:hypothetical protein
MLTKKPKIDPFCAKLEDFSGARREKKPLIESTERERRGSMNPETFPHQAALLEYAEAHGLVYAWEGTRSFEKRSRTLSPEQFQIVTVHTRRRGVTRVMLFSKDILKAEFEADRPRRDALAAKRAQWQARREAGEMPGRRARPRPRPRPSTSA